MRRRLTWRPGTRTRVAARTILWRSPENSRGMARLTGNLLVSAIKHEARGRVIKSQILRTRRSTLSPHKSPLPHENHGSDN